LYRSRRQKNRCNRFYKRLKDFYKGYFDIGVAIAPQHTEGADADFLKKHFNSLTAENVMKPALIHPKRIHIPGECG